MTLEELQKKYPAGQIDVGLAALHYVEGTIGLNVRFDKMRDEDALEQAIAELDKNIAAVKAAG